MHFCKVSVRVIILTLHYRGCRGLKFPSQGTLSPRAVLLVEVLYLVLLRCPWMQNRAAVCDGQKCSISRVVYGGLIRTQRGTLVQKQSLVCPPWVALRGREVPL